MMTWLWLPIAVGTVWAAASFAVIAFVRGAHVPDETVPQRKVPLPPLTFPEWCERMPHIPSDELREALEGLVRAGLMVETVRFEADGSKTPAWAITRTGLEIDVYA